ncbi:hypothetical protein QBC38DRAFT_543125 [Podospora fimiseda]|uniref:Uncharacterized protein n=1 Tax=Podospora fimiseda TaxID=252190 RepID=A0AAN7H385_9PEZI|nr:hypothetical protein QBC38DRAFT_543125 [Podospora fimiseda]
MDGVDVGDRHGRRRDATQGGNLVVLPPAGPEVPGHWHGWMAYLIPPTTRRQFIAARDSRTFDPSSSRGARRTPGEVLYNWVLEYIAVAPRCPPLFRQLIEHTLAIAPPNTPSSALLAGILINPNLVLYGLDGTFWDALERYTIFDGHWDGHLAVSLPTQMLEIPVDYLPRPLDWPIDHPSIEEQEIHVEEEVDDEVIRTTHERLERLTTGIRSDEHLAKIPGVVIINSVPVNNILPRDILTGLRQGGRDWYTPSWYGTVPQPPLAQRFFTIINFLADEDRDRTPDWETARTEIVRYLYWLAMTDKSGQLQRASLATRQMFECAVDMCMVHAVYERHFHGDTSALRLSRPDTTPLRSTRLNYLINPYDWPLPSRRGVPNNRQLIEKPITGRPVEEINANFTDLNIQNGNHGLLVLASREFWKPVAGRLTLLTVVPGDVLGNARQNLAFREHRAYEHYIRPGNVGWTLDDTFMLPLDIADPVPAHVLYAVERGARRAGLQKMLRYFGNGIHHAIQSPFRQLILQDERSIVKNAKKAEGIQWVPPALPASELGDPKNHETHRYDVAWGDFYVKLKSYRQLCQAEVQRERENTLPWVTLPKNVVNGGPYVWRMIDPLMQDQQDRLKRCLVMEKVLRAAYKKWPRKLLRRVVKAMGEAIRAPNNNHTVPAGITLDTDEQYETPRPIPPGRGPTTPRMVDYNDLVWLRRLAQPGVSEGTWERRYYPDTPEGKYRLYQIFARRVQKAMDDRNPNGLFANKYSRVTVDQLLNVINPGGGTPFVASKIQFGPYEACSYLDRMNHQGHLRFQQDPTCYGTISLPNARYFTEHRVIWPTPQPRRQNEPPPSPRPNWKAGSLRRWDEIINNPNLIADVKKGSRVYNFFMALGYRLGYTIFQLKHQMDTQNNAPARAPAVSTQRLLDAYGAFDRKVRSTHEKLDTSDLFHWHDEKTIIEDLEKDIPEFVVHARRPLDRIRSQVIEEISENKNMLAPAREIKLPNDGGSKFVYDVSWDWALYPKNYKAKPRQYWKLDRWPVEPGWYLDEATLRSITTDADVDPKWTFDATSPANDPVHDMYKRRKMEPYADKPIKFRPGPVVYPAGDTKFQRKKVEEHITDMVHQATGIGKPGQPGIPNRLLKYLTNGLSGTGLFEEEIAAEPKLPEIKQTDVPQSWDPNRDIHKEFHPYLKRRRVREEIAEGPKPDNNRHARDVCGKKKRKLDPEEYREIGQWENLG